MNFRSFRLSGFAQLQEIALDFADGVPSLIVGPNESGKSHLLMALIGTLFGLTPAEANACTPWDGEPVMCGVLDFEVKSERITLVRYFLNERVDVISDGETIYTGRGRTFGRGIAEDERYRTLLAGWLGFSEMDIFRDLVFVEQDQLSDHRLNKQAPEIKRLITGSREASYETALADLTRDLHTLKKRPRDKNDREIEQLQRAQADLLTRIDIAEQSEAAVIDLRESDLETRARLAKVQSRRATLSELLDAYRELTALETRLSDVTDDYERARRDREQANSSAERHATLLAEVKRLQVSGCPDLDTLRQARFELDDADEAARALQARLAPRTSSRELRGQPSQSPATARKRPRGALLLVAIVIALLSLLGAIAVDPRALIGLPIALLLAVAAFIFPQATIAAGSTRAELERQFAEQERVKLHEELERARTRLEHLSTQAQPWLTAAAEPDLDHLIARLEQHQQATIRLENAPVASPDEIERLRQEQQDYLTRMALTQQRIEQLRTERPELRELTAETVTQHRQAIERLDAMERELDQTLRANEIQHGVLNQSSVDDAAALRVALRENDDELARKQQLADALGLAIDTLRDCVSDFQENALDPVGDEAGRLLCRITAGRHHAVQLDPQTMEPVVWTGEQSNVPPATLSRGTRDQIYLAIRLALVDALSGGITLPLIFDDPCVHFDVERLAATASLLGEIARERQVILLSKDDTYTRWFAPTLRLQPNALVVPNGVSE